MAARLPLFPSETKTALVNSAAYRKPSSQSAHAAMATLIDHMYTMH